MNKAILITGSAGMVGSHLVEQLAEQGDAEIIASYLRPTILLEELLATAAEVISYDVTDRAATMELISSRRPVEIYHLAAQSLPTVSWEDPWETMRINSEGTINIFEAIRAVRATDPAYDPVVVVACSSAAYGATLTPENVPIKEDNILQPLHPYGVSKAAQDMLTFQYFMNYGIRGVRARIFNSTGPRKTRDVVSDFAARVAHIRHHGGALRVGNLETRRAILDVRDLVAALILLARKGAPGEAYNICAEQAHRIADLIPLFKAAAGCDFEVEPDPALFRPADEAIIFGDTTKLRNQTGWAPRVTIADTVAAVVEYELRRLRRSEALAQ